VLRRRVPRTWKSAAAAAGLAVVAMALAVVPGAAARAGAASAAAAQPAQATAARAPARSCASLAQLRFANTSVSATADPGNGGTPASCRVHLTIAQPPSTDRVNVWVYLPVTGWNGRFEGVGGGGYVGGSESSLVAPLQQGYAAGATDAGSPGTDASFFLNPDLTVNRQVTLDWGYLGVHLMTQDGKALVAAYYGTSHYYSYFNGCSTGGRQGLTEAQRYPGDYNGILAGSPVINFMQLIPGQEWPQLVMLESHDEIPACKYQAAVDAVTKACDTVGDGVRDGVIGDPMECHWNPSTLIGTKTPCGTITATDAAVIGKIFQGPRTSDGKFMWYGLMPGTRFSGIAATAEVDGKLTGQPWSTVPWADWYYQDPSWDWTTMTQASFEQAYVQGIQEWGPTQGSNNPDLRAYARDGGKILMWHGLADFGVMPAGSMDYYQRVKSVVGASTTSQFFRLFMASGVDHCGNGAGPQPTGQLDDLVSWVEHGQAPATINSVKTDASGKVTETRPICAYPGVARYTGHGSASEAANYRCVRGPSLVPRQA
jgi:Tannase and feruloyl esterase